MRRRGSLPRNKRPRTSGLYSLGPGLIGLINHGPADAYQLSLQLADNHKHRFPGSHTINLVSSR